MKRINNSDRMLLREMEETYGTDTIKNAIITICKDMENDCECNDDTCVSIEPKSPKDATLDYIKELEGFRIRLREIHWSATHNSLHKLTDDMIGKLEDYEDSIAEDFMGIIDTRIKVNQIIPILPKSQDAKDIMKELLNSTYTLIASIEGSLEYKGIVNILEEMVDYIWKCKYLETME